MTMRSTLAILAMATLCGPAHAEPALDPPAPPASPAPPSATGDLSAHLDELADARRAVLEAERELRKANAALARARGNTAREERAIARQQEAQGAFDRARDRVPEVVAQARAAGLSASAVRNYEHSLYGD